MTSNYKKLGPYIRQIDVRNLSGSKDNLLGVSTKKVFIKSIANTVGTNFTKYKIVKKGQFVYIADTSRRGDKIGIAFLDHLENAIVSQAYTVFEVTDHNQLDPEYLMMWFRRSEFDRYARFKSHGSVREIFGWDEMCDVELPIPDITEQKRILAEYKTVTNRIKLNKQLNKMLEDTAQSIYKQWFIDFEFPMPAKYAQSIGRPDLSGKPYKSSNNSIETNLPMGWRHGTLDELVTFKNGKKKPTAVNGSFSVYGGNGVLGETNEWNREDVIVIGRVGHYCGSLFRVPDKLWVSDNAISAESKIEANNFSYLLLKSLNLEHHSEGTGQPLITQSILNNIKLLIPPVSIVEAFEQLAYSITREQIITQNEMIGLQDLSHIILSSMSQSTRG